MTNRRQFLRNSVSLAVAAGAAPCAAIAQTGRKRVMVGGRPATVVDIHAHCILPELAERVPEAQPAPIIIPDLLSLGPHRIDLMDERGIDIQALSVNQYWWYDIEPELAARIVRVHDEGIAEWCAEHPDRFVGLSSVALQDPELAAEQLDYAVNVLDHRGASITLTA